MDVEEAAEEGAAPLRARHIKKRSLKNKALSVSFNEKDLKDFVTGFHKRKKKRRKEALQKQEEAERRKRIEQRKKRKLERDFVIYGGAAPESGTDDAGSDLEEDQDEESEQVPSVSGMMTYDQGDMQVTVRTSEIARGAEHPVSRPEVGRLESSEKSKQKIPVSKKKQLKRAPKKRSRPKTQSKRDKRKGGKKKNKRH